MIPYYSGDSYRLAPQMLAEDAWLAWQLGAPRKGEGLVHAFRREKAGTGPVKFKLRWFHPEVRYTVEDLDGEEVQRIAGGELMAKEET